MERLTQADIKEMARTRTLEELRQSRADAEANRERAEQEISTAPSDWYKELSQETRAFYDCLIADIGAAIALKMEVRQ
jgi:hypothetical protein